MRRYDDITESELRRELVGFARLVLTMEKHDALADRTASLLRLLGELRRMVFAYEVAHTNRDEPVQSRNPRPDATSRPLSDDEALDALVEESRRIVEEARERQEEFGDELRGRPHSPGDAGGAS
jgi:hypothetical protein